MFNDTLKSQIQLLCDRVESMQAEIWSLKELTGIEKIANSVGIRGNQNAIVHRPSKKRKLSQPTVLYVSPPLACGPRYQGLTSAEYSLKLASLNLAQLQSPAASGPSDLDACYDEGEDETNGLGDEADMSQLNPDTRSEQVSVQFFTEMSHSRARELIILYSEVVGTLHPIVDISIILDCVDGLYARLKLAGQKSDKLTDRYDVIVIRLVLSIALLSEENQDAALIERCYEGVEQELKAILFSETVSLHSITLMLIGVRS